MPKQTSPAIPKGSTGLSGEFFVAAELYRRGWLVGLTLGNAKSVDLIAEKDGTQISIQVKTMFKRSNRNWPIQKKSKSLANHFIFVILNADEMGPPDYFICKGSDFTVREFNSRDLVYLTDVSPFKGQWDNLLK